LNEHAPNRAAIVVATALYLFGLLYALSLVTTASSMSIDGAFFGLSILIAAGYVEVRWYRVAPERW